MVIRAPADGVVAVDNGVEGAYVTAGTQLAVAYDGSQIYVTARVDETENVRLFWATAAYILTETDAGRATIIFPTRRNLERIAQFADFDAAVADARAHPIRTVTPWTEIRDGVEHLCIPDDLGYPITSEPMSDAVRG